MSYIRLVAGSPEPFTINPQILYHMVAPICWPWPVPNSLLAEYNIYPVTDAYPVLEEYQIAQHSGFSSDAEGNWSVDYTTSNIDISAYESNLHDRIDRGCGEFRKNFITDVPGQAATYSIKEQEASDHTANPNGNFLFLEAEAQATGSTVGDIASQVTTLAGQWRQVGAAIEGMRIGAKRAVTLAKNQGDYAAMKAAADVNWNALLGRRALNQWKIPAWTG